MDMDQPDWERVEAEAKARAMAALRDDVTDDELVAIVRQLSDDMHAVPPRKRAVDALATTAEQLVEVLADAGVEFADKAMAPTQLAASMVAAWMQCDQHAVDSGDWVDVAACMPDAIAWARWNGTEAEPWARDTVRRIVEGDTP